MFHIKAAKAHILVNNHIPIRKSAENSSQQTTLAIYPEEMAYLLMVEQDCQQLSSSSRQDQLLNCYRNNNSDQGGLKQLDCTYFYLKMRKLSKQLYRVPMAHENPVFKVTGKGQTEEKERQSEHVMLVNSQQSISKVLENQVLQVDKIYICGNLDGVAISLGKPFILQHHL